MNKIVNETNSKIYWNDILFQNMFGAGGDTSSTVVESAMSEMLRNPKIMEKAQAR